MRPASRVSIIACLALAAGKYWHREAESCIVVMGDEVMPRQHFDAAAERRARQDGKILS